MKNVPVTRLRVIFCVVCLSNLSCCGQVIYSFQEVTDISTSPFTTDVIASISGSIALIAGFTGGGNNNQNLSGDEGWTTDNFLTAGGGNADRWKGNPISSGLSVAPDAIAFNETFGYGPKGNNLWVPTGTTGVYTPSFGTWTWTGKSLSDIGLGSLTTTPTTVYSQASGRVDDDIQFVRATSISAIPEPSSSFIFGTLVAIALLHQRRRVSVSLSANDRAGSPPKPLRPLSP